ncbi:hypothetical protein AMJ52_06515 [candidate division TA06 bacterium DG_78]|uniref:Uncharacterized protein n=1 Tax=candidate division TA06 bacterium DG_78 TaxID=1703772 RepID=A0A0S7YCS5_UNCT6|nr:MAG: hypothetical protein AMJ52_06515 [candidate division TA06 bacterium DG_78]
MINFILCYTILSVTIVPQNPFLDHYTIIPPLGTITSIATSPQYIFAASDNYLLFFNKHTLTLEKTVYLDHAINLIGYDQQYDDLWLFNTTSIVRFAVTSYISREYTFSESVTRCGIGIDYVYLDASQKYSLNKRTGEIKVITSFPENVKWHKKTTNSDIQQYRYLTPYYYMDDSKESQVPFQHYSITSIYDDGLWLYVGTDQFGLLQYNTVSWQKTRVIYGPLDHTITKIKKFDNNIYFISSSGVSYYVPGTSNWKYQRLLHDVTDFIWVDNNLIIGFENRTARAQGALEFTVSNFKTSILCLSSDAQYTYVGTKSGLYRIAKGSSEPLQFGPAQNPVHAVYPTDDAIYVGGEFGFYKYTKADEHWSEIINQGIKDIAEIKNEFYLLGVNNQLIKYWNSSDTGWILLPYFNIYDIDTDSEVLYCASYAGVYYYEPTTEFYKVIFDLPRIRYDYIFVIGDDILAVSNQHIYRLSIAYRD